MRTVTVSFHFPQPAYDGADEDIGAVHASIIAAFDHHFKSWGDGADAWQAYKQALDVAAKHDGELLPYDEALRVAVANTPKAEDWAAFLETAQDAGQGVFDCTRLTETGAGFGFSVKVITAGDKAPADSESLRQGPQITPAPLPSGI